MGVQLTAHVFMWVMQGSYVSSGTRMHEDVDFLFKYFCKRQSLWRDPDGSTWRRSAVMALILTGGSTKCFFRTVVGCVWWHLQLLFAARGPPKTSCEPRRGRGIVVRNSRISLSAGRRACEPAAKPAIPGVILVHNGRICLL
jgi:hypothetical protein